MPNPRIMAIHVPGPDFESDNDIQDSDSIILVPFSLAKAAMEMSEKENKEVYLYKFKGAWSVQVEDGEFPVGIDLTDKKRALCFYKDELKSHAYFATI